MPREHEGEFRFAACRERLTLSAFEFFTDRCVARLQRHRKLRMPLTTPSTHYVLVEAEAAGAELDPWMASLAERGLILDGTLAQSAQQAGELWALREGISESLSATGLPHKNDVALPIAALEAFCGEFEAVFAREYPGWEICLFGHIGDGNLHVNIMKPDSMPGCAVRNGGKPSLASGLTRRSMRRSVILSKSVKAMAA